MLSNFTPPYLSYVFFCFYLLTICHFMFTRNLFFSFVLLPRLCAAFPEFTITQYLLSHLAAPQSFHTFYQWILQETVCQHPPASKIVDKAFRTLHPPASLLPLAKLMVASTSLSWCKTLCKMGPHLQ